MIKKINVKDFYKEEEKESRLSDTMIGFIIGSIFIIAILIFNF